MTNISLIKVQSVKDIYGNQDILPRYLPFSCSPNFIEKENVFNRIDDHFKTNKNNKIILHGHPGIGKTTHAVHYGYMRFRGTCRFMNAETDTKLEKCYRDVAKLLHLKDPETKMIDILLQQINSRLATSNQPVLIILDSVEDLEYNQKLYEHC